jgi:hypothetical protein
VLIVLVSVGMGYVVLLAPTVASQLASGGGQLPAVITVASQATPTLDPADIDALTRALPGTTISRTLIPGPTLATATVPALDVEPVDAAFFGVYGLKAAKGAFFTPADDLRANQVAVLGQQAAQTLFGDATSATGKSLRVRNVSLTVIGVIAQPDNPDLASFSQEVFVPLQTGKVRLVGAQAPTELVIGVANGADAANLAASAARVLALRYPSAASRFSVHIHNETQQPVSLPELLGRAAAAVHADFLEAKDLTSTPRQSSPALAASTDPNLMTSSSSM